jgi:hypothetical protein
MMTRNKEIHLQPTVNRILNLHLRIGERDFKEESPKRVRANDTVPKYPRISQPNGWRHAAWKLTQVVRYTRKSPHREYSVLVHGVPRGARRQLDSQNAEMWGCLSTRRHLLRLERCIAYGAEQNVGGPSDT